LLPPHEQPSKEDAITGLDGWMTWFCFIKGGRCAAEPHHADVNQNPCHPKAIQASDGILFVWMFMRGQQSITSDWSA